MQTRLAGRMHIAIKRTEPRAARCCFSCCHTAASPPSAYLASASASAATASSTVVNVPIGRICFFVQPVGTCESRAWYFLRARMMPVGSPDEPRGARAEARPAVSLVITWLTPPCRHIYMRRYAFPRLSTSIDTLFPRPTLSARYAPKAVSATSESCLRRSVPQISFRACVTKYL